MQWLRNKTFILVVVIVLIAGLVLAYMPLLFAPPASPRGERPAPEPSGQIDKNQATASLLPVQGTGESAPNGTGTAAGDETQQSPEAVTSSGQQLEGLEGLGEEQKALDDLNQLFQ